jgi:hypothetical protein
LLHACSRAYRFSTSPTTTSAGRGIHLAAASPPPPVVTLMHAAASQEHVADCASQAQANTYIHQLNWHP